MTGIITSLKSRPQVGKIYLVPAIRFDRTCGEGEERRISAPRSRLDKALWWPVIGDRHSDADFFNFPGEHYHADLRFVGRRHLAQSDGNQFSDRMSYEEGKLAGLATAPMSAPGFCSKENIALYLPKPQLRRFTMKREFPVWAFWSRAVRLRAAYAGKQCRSSAAGWVCPHRNYPLGQTAPDADGIIQCPLHGLRINATTGIIVEAEAG